MKERITTAMKEAMKQGEKERLSTIRLIMAAIKDKEIAQRSLDNPTGELSPSTLFAVLEGMIKQRHQSIELYQQGSRQDLADKEQQEIKVIESFLPEKLSPEKQEEIILSAITFLTAQSMQDMGKVVSHLKEIYPGQMDLTLASQIVKKALS